jgi:Cu+-exporting ATPase
VNAPPAGTTLEHLDLELTGMTCAACANRIEKKLNRLDGVTATVNYATEKANVEFDPEVATPADADRDGAVDRLRRRMPAGTGDASRAPTPGTRPHRRPAPPLQRLAVSACSACPCCCCR